MLTPLMLVAVLAVGVWLIFRPRYSSTPFEYVPRLEPVEAEKVRLPVEWDPGTHEAAFLSLYDQELSGPVDTGGEMVEVPDLDLLENIVESLWWGAQQGGRGAYLGRVACQCPYGLEDSVRTLGSLSGIGELHTRGPWSEALEFHAESPGSLRQSVRLLWPECQSFILCLDVGDAAASYRLTRHGEFAGLQVPPGAGAALTMVSGHPIQALVVVPQGALRAVEECMDAAFVG